MDPETEQRIKEIRKRLKKFLAAEDIEFLLKENKRLNEELKQSKKFIYNLGAMAQPGKKNKKKVKK